MLERYRLANTEEEFWHKLDKPRAFANEVGAGLGEYLCRALSHQAAITEPKDLAWLLASYARDGLARVEAAGDTRSLDSVRLALEESLGVHFKEGARRAFFPLHTGADTLLRHFSPRGCFGPGRRVIERKRSTGTNLSGTYAHR